VIAVGRPLVCSPLQAHDDTARPLPPEPPPRTRSAGERPQSWTQFKTGRTGAGRVPRRHRFFDGDSVFDYARKGPPARPPSISLYRVPLAECWVEAAAAGPFGPEWENGRGHPGALASPASVTPSHPHPTQRQTGQSVFFAMASDGWTTPKRKRKRTDRAPPSHSNAGRPEQPRCGFTTCCAPVGRGSGKLGRAMPGRRSSRLPQAPWFRVASPPSPDGSVISAQSTAPGGRMRAICSASAVAVHR